MNTAYTLIRRHCHNQLVERGWPDDLDIETNLSYCQGDGVAFYGRIHTCCILKLLPEMAGRGYLSEQDWREVDDCIGESNLNIVLSLEIPWQIITRTPVRSRWNMRTGRKP